MRGTCIRIALRRITLRRITLRRITLWTGCTLGLCLLTPGLGYSQRLPGVCGQLLRRDRSGHFLARADLFPARSAVAGDHLLAVVNRAPEGGLPPDYAPRDLVDLETGRRRRPRACTPPTRMCLRREAATAFRRLARAMRRAGYRPHVSSAFRSYRVQCATFLRWVRRSRDGFCGAATASALPGHSQHQLGTALDLFSEAWARAGNKFRPGYGCTAAGRWIAAHAPRFGFVLPYPLHPDHRDPARPCTGDEARVNPQTLYRYEPWHLRYIGIPAAARFAAVPGDAALDGWLAAQRRETAPVQRAPVQRAPAQRARVQRARVQRARVQRARVQRARGRRAGRTNARTGARAIDRIGPTASLPVCDGCNCAACATLAGEDERRPCPNRYRAARQAKTDR